MRLWKANGIHSKLGNRQHYTETIWKDTFKEWITYEYHWKLLNIIINHAEEETLDDQKQGGEIC